MERGGKNNANYVLYDCGRASGVDLYPIGGLTMLEYIVPLVASFLPMFEYALWYVLALCFICFVPCLMRRFFMR